MNLNEVTSPGLSVDVKLLFLSPSLHKEHLRVRALHSFPGDAHLLVNLSAEVKHPSIPILEGVITELRAYVTKMLPDPSVVSFVFEGNLLNIGLNLTSFVKLGNVM